MLAPYSHMVRGRNRRRNCGRQRLAKERNDNAHINLAELDALLKGVNMALKWCVSGINIRTDSATVYK